MTKVSILKSYWSSETSDKFRYLSMAGSKHGGVEANVTSTNKEATRYSFEACAAHSLAPHHKPSTFKPNPPSLPLG